MQKEKELNLLEMAHKLQEDPRRRAVNERHFQVMWYKGAVVFVASNEILKITDSSMNANWEIIEPEPEFSPGDAVSIDGVIKEVFDNSVYSISIQVEKCLPVEKCLFLYVQSPAIHRRIEE
jgi:hypothetical protein